MNKTKKKLSENIESFFKKYKKPTYSKLIRFLLHKPTIYTRKIKNNKTSLR